jgi:hypothetical protein
MKNKRSKHREKSIEGDLKPICFVLMPYKKNGLERILKELLDKAIVLHSKTYPTLLFDNRAAFINLNVKHMVS